MAYSNVYGVRHTLWTEEDVDGPTVDEVVDLEEMYVDNDYLLVRFITDEGGHTFEIPIHHNDDWVDLVNSLPTW